MGVSMNVVVGVIIYSVQSVVISTLVKQTSPLSPDKFGPSNSHFSNIEPCKGPKKNDCTIIGINSANNDFTNVTFTLDFKKNAQISKTKITLWMNESLSSPDIVKVIDNPCRHFFLGPLLEKIFNPNSNCVVKKGIYATRVNASALLSELLGISFFYGTYKSQTNVLSKDCNIICVRTKFELERKYSRKPNPI